MDWNQGSLVRENIWRNFEKGVGKIQKNKNFQKADPAMREKLN